jgi:hypothetical protein
VAAPWISEDLRGELTRRVTPAVTQHNRLEGRPRTERFDRALRAEVRDALWMLSRQWQMGEFAGDDAASPITARIRMRVDPITGLRLGEGAEEPLHAAMPLEARVEARPLAPGLDLRLVFGRQWLKMIGGLADVREAFTTRYPVDAPDLTNPADVLVASDPVVASAFTAASRRMDGVKLLEHLRGGGHAWDGITELDAWRDETDEIAGRFVAWTERLVHVPAQEGAWVPDRLEYRFACTTGGREFVAGEFHHGRLDWYAFDGGSSEEGDESQGDTSVVLPAPVAFDGMPNTRWWAFEDGRTNFGDVRADSTDLGRLLLLEFALVYANDWFVVPYTLPASAVAGVQALEVTDVFGGRTAVEPATEDGWAMFALSSADDPDRASDAGLVLLPTTAGALEARPLEEVALVRDEVANMVWGVERVVPLPTGAGGSGAEAGRLVRAFWEAELERGFPGGGPGIVPGAPGALVRYEVMRGVPEHWIPFVGVHVPGDVREIQLQRAAMLRLLEGDPDPQPIRPRTSLLREGLDAGEKYLLHEEEVPRAGVHVSQALARVRARDGRPWVWLGARKQTGRGEGSSGLEFDRLTDLPAQPQ